MHCYGGGCLLQLRRGTAPYSTSSLRTFGSALLQGFMDAPPHDLLCMRVFDCACISPHAGGCTGIFLMPACASVGHGFVAVCMWQGMAKRECFAAHIHTGPSSPPTVMTYMNMSWKDGTSCIRNASSKKSSVRMSVTSMSSHDWPADGLASRWYAETRR